MTTKLIKMSLCELLAHPRVSTKTDHMLMKLQDAINDLPTDFLLEVLEAKTGFDSGNELRYYLVLDEQAQKEWENYQ